MWLCKCKDLRTSITFGRGKKSDRSSRFRDRPQFLLASIAKNAASPANTNPSMDAPKKEAASKEEHDEWVQQMKASRKSRGKSTPTASTKMQASDDPEFQSVVSQAMWLDAEESKRTIDLSSPAGRSRDGVDSDSAIKRREAELRVQRTLARTRSQKSAGKKMTSTPGGPALQDVNASSSDPAWDDAGCDV